MKQKMFHFHFKQYYYVELDCCALVDYFEA